jgi:hypothetical protein
LKPNEELLAKTILFLLEAGDDIYIQLEIARYGTTLTKIRAFTTSCHPLLLFEFHYINAKT